MLSFPGTLLTGSRVSVPSPIRNAFGKITFQPSEDYQSLGHTKEFSPTRLCLYLLLCMTSQRVRFSWQRVFHCPLTTDRPDISRTWETKSIGKDRIYPTVLSQIVLPSHGMLSQRLIYPSVAAVSLQFLPIVPRARVRGDVFQFPQNKVKGLLYLFSWNYYKMDFTEHDRIDLLYLLLPYHNGPVFSLNWEPIPQCFHTNELVFLSIIYFRHKVKDQLFHFISCK